MSPVPEILFERRGGVGFVRLNRPQALNALTLSLIDAFDTRLRAWAGDPAVHAVVVRGAGNRAFCAGGDIRGIWEGGRTTDGPAAELFRREYRLIRRIKVLPKPYVALIGGIAMGEVFYRLTSTILDTEARGWGRFWREAGAFLLNPIRGFNRITSGRAWEVRPNPAERAATPVANRLMVGTRTVGEGRLRNNAETGVFFETAFRFGDPMAAANTGPFEWFTLGVQLNFGEEGKSALGRINIRGNLYTSDMKREEGHTRRFAILQNFTYWNNRAFEFGS